MFDAGRRKGEEWLYRLKGKSHPTKIEAGVK